MRWVVFVGVLLAIVAVAQTATVNQGKPGNQGPWPVSISGGSVVIVVDGGFNVTQLCSNIIQSTTQVNGATLPVPAVANNPRVWVQVCNGVQNASNLQCQCVAGAAAVYGNSQPGDTLNTGDCATYNINSFTNINCVCNADAGTSYLASTECQP